jgi:hypothetical protein
MEQETLAAVDAQKTEDAEASVADFLFGEEEQEEEYVPDPKPVVEGEDTTDEKEVEAKEEEPETDMVEVEWEGQLIEAPKAVAEALMRQSDYTQKTQEVAQQRKEVDVQLGSLEHTRKQFEFAESIQGDVIQAQQFEREAEQLYEWMQNNVGTVSSTELEQVRFRRDDLLKQRDEIVQSVQGKQSEFQQAQEQSYQELLNKGTEVLQQRIPGWGEDQQKSVRDYALSNGFTEAEISQVVDPRQVETLWKAAQYDALKSGAVPAVKKVQEAPAIKPKARDPKTGRFKAQQNLQKKLKSNLSTSEKASLIGNDIAARFFE